MRLALLTDIHANREALTACLEHAAQHKADRYAFTGDFVGYGADPGWVVDTVMQHVARGAVAVMGNHDHSVTQPTKPQMHAEAREVIEWTRGQMNAEQLDFLSKLPLVVDQDRLSFVHASAHEPQKWEYGVFRPRPCPGPVPPRRRWPHGQLQPRQCRRSRGRARAAAAAAPVPGAAGRGRPAARRQLRRLLRHL
jgi:predicted phosphodiesterase